MITVKMDKIDVGSFGESYILTLGNIENPNQKEIKIQISEYEAEKLMPLFSHTEKYGKFNENQKWI